MTFTLDPEILPVKRYKSAKAALVLLAFAFPIFFGMDYVWPPSHGSRNVSSLLMASAIWAAGFTVLSLASSRLFRRTKDERYQLKVGDDEIIMNFDYLTVLIPMHIHQNVRCDEIKTILERKNGLTISKHNRIATYFLGGVWVPKQLPEYEYLKNLALSWKASTGS